MVYVKNGWLITDGEPPVQISRIAWIEKAAEPNEDTYTRLWFSALYINESTYDGDDFISINANFDDVRRALGIYEEDNS